MSRGKKWCQPFFFTGYQVKVELTQYSWKNFPLPGDPNETAFVRTKGPGSRAEREGLGVKINESKLVNSPH